MSDTTPRGFLTAPEAATELGVARETLTRWARQGRIPGAQIQTGLPGGDRWLIPRRWLRRGNAILVEAQERFAKARLQNLKAANHDVADQPRDETGKFRPKGEV